MSKKIPDRTIGVAPVIPLPDVSNILRVFGQAKKHVDSRMGDTLSYGEHTQLIADYQAVNRVLEQMDTQLREGKFTPTKE